MILFGSNTYLRNWFPKAFVSAIYSCLLDYSLIDISYKQIASDRLSIGLLDRLLIARLELNPQAMS